MADQKLDHNDDSNQFESSLAQVSPAPLGVTTGMVMYESGREVGRQEAIGDQQSRVQRSLMVWRLTTAASFALAMFSFFGTGSQTGDDRPPIVDSSTDAPMEIADSKPQVQPTPVSVRRPQSLSAGANSFWSFRGFPTNERTLIGIRNRMTNPVFASEIERFDSTTSFSDNPSSNAFQLMHTYKDSGVF